MKRVVAFLTILACSAVLCGCGAKETVVTPEFDVMLYSGASLSVSSTQGYADRKQVLLGRSRTLAKGPLSREKEACTTT